MSCSDHFAMDASHGSMQRRLCLERGTTTYPILKNSTILKIMEKLEVPLMELELMELGRCKERVREVFVQLVSF